MIMMSAYLLDQHMYTLLNFDNVSSVKQQSVDRHVTLLFWFWYNQSLLLLFNAVYLAEEKQMTIL